MHRHDATAAVGRGAGRRGGLQRARPRRTVKTRRTAGGPDGGCPAYSWPVPVVRSSRMTTDFDVGVLLTAAVESSGTRTLASGK